MKSPYKPPQYTPYFSKPLHKPAAHAKFEMPPSRETLKEKLLQWRYDTAVRRSNEGRVAMFGTAWIMSDAVLDHLASCTAEDRIRTTQDLQREAHDWPADKQRDLGESLMAVILAASAPPIPAPLNTGVSKARKRRPPVCAVCKMTGHKSACTSGFRSAQS